VLPPGWESSSSSTTLDDGDDEGWASVLPTQLLRKLDKMRDAGDYDDDSGSGDDVNDHHHHHHNDSHHLRSSNHRHDDDDEDDDEDDDDRIKLFDYDARFPRFSELVRQLDARARTAFLRATVAVREDTKQAVELRLLAEPEAVNNPSGYITTMLKQATQRARLRLRRGIGGGSDLSAAQEELAVSLAAAAAAVVVVGDALPVNANVSMSGGGDDGGDTGTADSTTGDDDEEEQDSGDSDSRNGGDSQQPDPGPGAAAAQHYHNSLSFSATTTTTTTTTTRPPSRWPVFDSYELDSAAKKRLRKVPAIMRRLVKEIINRSPPLLNPSAMTMFLANQPIEELQFRVESFGGDTATARATTTTSSP
jgi:hypothetical protein